MRITKILTTAITATPQAAAVSLLLNIFMLTATRRLRLTVACPALEHQEQTPHILMEYDYNTLEAKN